MTKLLWIAAGGALGAVLRYLLAGWAQRLVSGTFPVGTLAVNVVGCLLIGVLAARLVESSMVPEHIRLALLIGVLGGFTTFSTYAWETVSLIHDGQFVHAAANVLISNLAGLAAAWLGYGLAVAWR